MWSTIRKRFILPTSISRAMKIAPNIDFVPSRLDAGFKIWAEKGLNTIDKLFGEGVLRSFDQLQKKFGLLTHDFYRYLQLRNYLQKHKDWEILKESPSNIERFFILMIEGLTNKVKSNMYKILQEETVVNSKQFGY